MTASPCRLREKRTSVRLLWPFLRLLEWTPPAAEILRDEGLALHDLGRPDTRLRHGAALDLLAAWSRHAGDDGIGLRAALVAEPGDLDTVEYAARACPTLREAIACVARYMHLLNEAIGVTLVESDDEAIWRFRVNDGAVPCRPANDFFVAWAVGFARRYARLPDPAIEVQLMHPAPVERGPYLDLASGVRFGSAHNGVVLASAALDRPLASADAVLRDAFEAYAREQSQRLLVGVRGRVREAISSQIASGDMSMESVASALGLSVSTLRRRLAEEGITFTTVVDDVRRDLAERHLLDPRRTIGEIAVFLGFAHAPAFHKAFRRWTGATPSAWRAQATA